MVDLFVDWLLHEYSDRYRSIVKKDQQAWLRQVVILAIARHLIDQFHADLDMRARGGLFALPESLPPLLAGVGLPFGLLSQEKGVDR